jgi:hypothetical protein
VDAGVWPVFCSLRDTVSFAVGDEIRSYFRDHCVTPAECRNGRRSWYLELLLLWRPPGWEGRRLRPLGEIVHSDQEISVSLVAEREGSSYIDSYSFEWGPNIALVHLATTPCPRAATSRTDVALSATYLDVHSLPVANSTDAESYSGFYWHHGKICSSFSRFSTLLRENYFCSTLNRPLAVSQLRSGKLFLTGRDFHWAQ